MGRKYIFTNLILMYVLALSLNFTGCATSPTGRGQLQLMPDSQMNSMGAQAFEQMKAETPIEKDAAKNKYVKCIVLPIVKVLPGAFADQKWEVVVFDRPDTVNAFALPGGKIGVYTGLLKVAKTPDQLAAVLGHEVGHVIAKHGNERVSENLAAQGGLLAAGLLTKDNPRHGLLMGLLGLGAQYGFLLPHGRTQESEADIIGLDLMSRAGFNPRESVELWKNMEKASGKGPMEFLSTHPSHDTRIKGLESQMAESTRKFEEALASGNRPNCSPHFSL